MQMEKAQRLREERDDKSCDNHKFEKEYFLGAQTGDYVCANCGQYQEGH